MSKYEGKFFIFYEEQIAMPGHALAMFVQFLLIILICFFFDGESLESSPCFGCRLPKDEIF